MKSLLRIFISLLIVLWLGAVMFFPSVAIEAFDHLSHPEAGLVVRNCLLVLHTEGLIVGAILLILLIVAGFARAYGRSTLGPVLCTVAMLLLTAYSQYSIMPRMESDRIAVGGDIDKAAGHDPHRMEFNTLHNRSEQVEEGVLLAGVLMVVLLAAAPGPGTRP